MSIRKRTGRGRGMAFITRRRACRSCGGTELTRYHRKAWMRLFRGSQLLRCRQCRSTILLLRESDPVESSDPGKP